MRTERVNEILSDYSSSSYSLMRLGLGFSILLAGTHKLFRPDIWASYTAPWAADIITLFGVTVETFMRANGVLEAVLGIAILAERYTTIASALVSLSLLGIVINLATAGTSFTDILIRDIALLALAVGVTLMSAERTSRPVHSRF